MKSTELLNTKVIHKMLGEGIITEAGDNYVSVKFASKVSRFIFPIAFEKFITAENSDIQDRLLKKLTEPEMKNIKNRQKGKWCVSKKERALMLKRKQVLIKNQLSEQNV